MAYLNFSTQQAICNGNYQNCEVLEYCNFFAAELNAVVIERSESLQILPKIGAIQLLPKPLVFKGTERYVVAFNFLRKFLGYRTHKSFAFLPATKDQSIFMGFTLTDETTEVDELICTTSSDGIFEYQGNGQVIRSDLPDIMDRVCPLYGLTTYFTPALAAHLGA